jgi:hypothetical protein
MYANTRRRGVLATKPQNPRRCEVRRWANGYAVQEELGCTTMQKWEYATVPLLSHATKQILDQWGEDGWELVAVLPGPTGEQMVAYLKRPKEA